MDDQPSFSISLVGGIINSWLILMYWFSKFLSSSFWLWSYPVSLISFCLPWSKSWYFPKDLSKIFHILKVRSGSTWVIFYQYFLPSLAIRSFFSRSESCFKERLVVLYSIFFLSSFEFIHSTRKSTTRTGSTLKSVVRSTLASSSSIGGGGGGASCLSFFSSLLLLLFALSSSSLASCSLLNFSSWIACFSFSLTYLHLLAI